MGKKKSQVKQVESNIAPMQSKEAEQPKEQIHEHVHTHEEQTSENEEKKIVFENFFIVYKKDDLYSVVLKQATAKSKSVYHLPLLSSLKETVEQVPDFYSKCKNSLIVLCRMFFSPEEIGAYFSSPDLLDEKKQLKMHVLVDTKEDGARYEMVCENVFGFLISNHDNALPINQNTPRYLEAFKHVWMTYFGARFKDKGIQKYKYDEKEREREEARWDKRLKEAEGFRLCMFKPYSFEADWCREIEHLAKFSTNLFEKDACRSGLEIIKHLEMMASGIIYDDNCKPIIITNADPSNEEATLLYNTDIDPLYLARIFKARLSTDKDFMLEERSYLKISHIGNFKLLGESAQFEAHIVSVETDIGRRMWRAEELIDSKNKLEQQFLSCKFKVLPISHSFPIHDEICLYFELDQGLNNANLSLCYQPGKEFLKNKTKKVHFDSPNKTSSSPLSICDNDEDDGNNSNISNS
jgi:hypothetical protein